MNETHAKDTVWYYGKTLEIPDWTNYLSVTSRGIMVAHEEYPSENLETDMHAAMTGRFRILGSITERPEEPPGGWRNSLVRVKRKCALVQMNGTNVSGKKCFMVPSNQKVKWNEFRKICYHPPESTARTSPKYTMRIGNNYPNVTFSNPIYKKDI